MHRLLCTLVALTLLTAPLAAERFYILTEGDCADRVRYQQAIATQPRTDYYAYHFRLADGGRLMLETGMESGDVLNYLPVGYLGCNDPRLNASLLERVGNGQDEITILRPAFGGQYYASSVTAGGLLNRVDGQLSYRSKLAGLRLDERYSQIDDNVTYQNPSAAVSFQGLEDGPCGGAYLFKQTDPQGPYPVITYRISPHVGLLERRLGSDGLNTSGGVVVARAINGKPVLDYLATECQKLQKGALPRVAATPPATQPSLTPSQPTYQSPQPYQNPNGSMQPYAGSVFTNPAYGGAANQVPSQTAKGGPAPQTYNGNPAAYQTSTTPQPESRAALGTTGGTATNGAGETHVVRKGETLYSISSDYNTTVADVKRLNGLTDNTIFPGQRLTIMAASTTTTTAPTTPTISAPGTYGNGYTPVAVPSTRMAEGTHIVQAGETVASLALRNGYTEARFREFNGLGPADIVYIGQAIKTEHCAATPTTPNFAPVRTSPAPAAAPTTTNQPITLPDTPRNQPGQTAPFQPQSYGSTPAAPTTYGTTLPTKTTQNQWILNDNYQPNRNDAPAFVPVQPRRSVADPRPSAAPNTYRQPVSTARPQTLTELESAGYGSRVRTPNPYAGTPLNTTQTTAAPQPTSPEKQRRSHVVQPNEDLSSVARRYGISVDELRRLNGLWPGEVVVPSQKIYLE